MKQLAAMMMFAAWLLYGAMPAMAQPAMPVLQTPVSSVQTHDPHDGTTAMAMDAHAASSDKAQHHDGQKPCPHGSGKGCVAPFCAACLVLLPEIAFGEIGRFIHPQPEPQDGPALVLVETRPPVPPPRA